MDLNRVRAGVVAHPRDGPWTGYQELMGVRQRYRVVDLPRLLEHVGAESQPSFRTSYEQGLEQAIQRGRLRREAQWTEYLAVWTEAFARDVGGKVQHRMHVEVIADDLHPTM